MLVGVCKAALPAWFYDHLEGECRQFLYGGCNGNDNRFDTKEACESTCDSYSKCSGVGGCVGVEYNPWCMPETSGQRGLNFQPKSILHCNCFVAADIWGYLFQLKHQQATSVWYFICSHFLWDRQFYSLTNFLFF